MTLNLRLGDEIVEIFQQREGGVSHVIEKKNFNFSTGSEREMLAGKYWINTVCGETYKYTRNSVHRYLKGGSLLRNACESCFYD